MGRQTHGAHPMGWVGCVLVGAWVALGARINERLDKTLEITVGSSQTLRLAAALDKVVVGDPSICDVVTLPSHQLLLTAKSAGETQITVWSKQAGVSSYRVVASAPVAALQQALRNAFPHEDNLQVHAAGGAVYLTGALSDATVSDAAVRLANTMLASGGRRSAEVISLTTITGVQQVQLQLRFVEISRTALRAMGFNFWHNSRSHAGGLFGPGTPRNYAGAGEQRFDGPAVPHTPYTEAPPGGAGGEGLSTTSATIPDRLPMLVSPISDASGAFSLAFAATRFFPLSATLSLLEGHGAAKTLSEPTLVALSGEKARFLVGGEFPFPVPDALGRIIIQFKSYGAQLTFVPTVLDQETIHLSIDAEVSDLDSSSGVTLGNITVPGLKSRQSSTALRMRDGQSFAMAGLLSDRIFSSHKKVPWLGDIPLVGLLFRSVSYDRAETELVMLVSVRLVKPMDAHEVPQAIQEDEFSDPNDLQLFLLGITDRTQASGKKDPIHPIHPVTPAVGSPRGAMGFSHGW